MPSQETSTARFSAVGAFSRRPALNTAAAPSRITAEAEKPPAHTGGFFLGLRYATVLAEMRNQPSGGTGGI